MSSFIPPDAKRPPYPPTIEVKIKGEFTVVDIVPEDIDVRVYDAMPLNLKMLFGSDLYMSADDEAFKAAITLWGRAWHQVPAASLPADEAQICWMAGYGRDIRRWRRVKKWALHGFEMCSDGRLYHSVLAEIALGSWRTIRSNKGNARHRWEKAHAIENTQNTPMPSQEPSTRPDTIPASPAASQGNGIEGNGYKKERKGRGVSPKITPPGKPGEAPDTTAKKATRLPPDWTPSPELSATVLAMGFTPGQVITIAETFKDYWTAKPGKDGTKLDWDATFRNWARKENPTKVKAAAITAGQEMGEDLFHWRLRIKAFRARGFWIGQFGEKPTEKNCRCPLSVLIEFGYRNDDGSIPNEFPSPQQSESTA